MIIRENISLAPFNTFGIDVKARFLAEFDSEEEMLSFVRSPDLMQYPPVILGEGSNVLFTKDYPGSVIRVNTKGIQVIDETPDEVVIRVAAGEVWDDVVAFCVEKGWGGIENLSLIPGKMGAGGLSFGMCCMRWIRWY